MTEVTVVRDGTTAWGYPRYNVFDADGALLGSVYRSDTSVRTGSLRTGRGTIHTARGRYWKFRRNDGTWSRGGRYDTRKNAIAAMLHTFPARITVRTAS